MHKRWIVLICAVMFSCGEQNPNAVDLDVNRPFITRIVPGNARLTVYFIAQNRESGFSGYNIYFGNDKTTVRQQMLLSSSLVKPTVRADASAAMTEYSFTVEHNATYYKNSSGLPGTVSLFNGVIYHFWVAAYREVPEKESTYDDNYTASAAPRPEVLSYGAAANTILAFPDAVGRVKFTNASGLFCLMETNGGGVQDMGIASALSDVVTAPTNGYSSAPVTMHTGHLYSIVTGTAVYAKVFVHSIAGASNSAVVDYCYQPTANVTSY